MSIMMLPAEEAAPATGTAPTNGTAHPNGTAPATSASAPSLIDPFVSEGSTVARFVVLLTPIFAVLAGLLGSWVTRAIPGTHLDTTQVTTFMVAAATTALAASLQWLRGWQQHERLVAEGKAAPRVAVNIPRSSNVSN